SYGILAADAGALSVEGSNITGNGGPGFGVYSANATVTGVGTETVEAGDDYWGASGTPLVEGPVDTTPVAGSAATVAATPALMPDKAPTGEIVNPAGGEAVEVGSTIEPVVLAEDDYGVKSVALKVDGEPVATVTEAPYTYSWTPTAAETGTSVQLEATITDSSGQVTTSDVSVPVVPVGSTAKGRATQEKEARAAAEAEAQEAIAAAEVKLAEATAKAEAAAKATETATAEGKAAEEEAAAALKAAEDKVAKVEAELKAAEKAAPAPTAKAGKLTKNTKTGTARLGVVVSAPGSLVISGPDIAKVSGHPTGPGEVQVLIKAKGKALKTLNTKGKVSVKVTIAFTAGGKTITKTTTVSLVKK
ncbi:MAG TPA: Ig-like domain-containing protein, partial [Solirubrobacterales bacterium]|nr:Ig-like domain-containing protein [Solirubrobacterales bacterium]